ncbi:MAG: DJ-1/PfpI family protein [Sedimentisphaerales bacterium]
MKKVLLFVLLLTSSLLAQPAAAAGEAITIIRLPEPVLKGSISLEQAIKNLRSIQQFTAEPLKINQISQLCWAGITEPNSGLRSAPSAMVTNPMQLYVVLPDGLYLYEPNGNDLVKYINGDLRPGLFAAAFRQRIVQSSPCIFIISGFVNKIEAKFRGRGEKLLYLEAGRAAQNIDLQALTLGLGSVPVGAFDSKTVARICKFAEDLEPVYLICTGNISQKLSLVPVLSPETVQSPAVSQPVDMTKKRAVIIVASHYFNDQEFFDVQEALNIGGVKVDFASSITGEIKGVLMNTVTVTVLVKNIRVDDYDAFIFIGSQTENEYFTNKDALNLVREANNKGKIIAAIDTAPGIFANAGIVKGKNVTSYFTQRTNLVQAGAKWENNPLEIDGNLITANDQQISRRFGVAILDSLRHQGE